MGTNNPLWIGPVNTDGATKMPGSHRWPWTSQCGRSWLESPASRWCLPSRSSDGPYEMDPALQMPVLPGLAEAQKLGQLQPDTNEYGFLRTKLVRQRNRVHDALLQACDVAEGLV